MGSFININLFKADESRMQSVNILCQIFDELQYIRIIAKDDINHNIKMKFLIQIMLMRTNNQNQARRSICLPYQTNKKTHLFLRKVSPKKMLVCIFKI